MSENRRFHKTVSIIVSMLFLINNISWQAPDITQDMQKEDTLKALSARLDGQTADTVGQSLLETKVLAVNSPAASVETRIGFSAKFSSKPFSAGNTISPADLSDELLKTIGIKRYNIKEVRRYSKGYIIIFTTGAISAEGGSAYILSPDKELIAGADYLVGSESSPDNRYVAFIHKDYVSLYDFDSKKPTEAILVYSEEDIVAEYKVTFSPDSSYVLIKSSWGHQLYKYNVYDLQHPEKPIKIDNLSQWLPNHIEVNFDPTSKNLEFKIKRVGYPGEEWKEPLPQKTALTSPKPSSAGTEVVDTGRFKFTVDQELLALLEKQDTSGNIKAVTAKINQIMSGIKDNSIPRSEIYSRFAYAFDETSEGIRRVDIPKGEGEISSLFLVEARLPGHAEIEFIAILAYQYYLDKRYNFPFIFGVVTGITPDNKIGYFGDYHGNLLAAAMKFAKTLKTSSAGMVEVDEFLRSQGVCALISPSVENAEELIKIIADAEYPYLGVEIAFRGDRDRVLSLIKFASEYSKSKIVVAAGTVLDGVDAFDAITNGASLIVTPGLTLTKADIMMFHNLGAKVIMGAGSPQEAQRAKNRGADAIKAFPYNIKGDHMKALKGPLPSKYHDSADKYVRLIKGGKDTLATFTYIYEWLRTNPTKSKRFKLPLTEKDLVKAIRSAIPSGAPLFITGGVLAEDIKAGLLDDLKIGAALSVKDINEAKKLAEVMKGRTAKTSSAGNIKIEALNLAIEQTEEKPFVRLIQILNRDLTSSIVDTTGSLSSKLIRNELRKFVGLDHIYIDTFVTLDNPSNPDKERLYLFWANIQNKPYLCMLVRKDASDGVKQYEFTPYRVTNITDYDINTIVESLRIGGVTEILTRDTWFKNILHQRRISSSAIAQLEKPQHPKTSSAGDVRHMVEGAVNAKLTELLSGLDKPIKVVNTVPIDNILNVAIKRLTNDRKREIFIEKIIGWVNIMKQRNVICHAVNREVTDPHNIPPISDDSWKFYNDRDWKAVSAELYTEYEGLTSSISNTPLGPVEFLSVPNSQLLGPDEPLYVPDEQLIACVKHDTAVTEVEIGLPIIASLELLIENAKKEASSQKTSSAGDIRQMVEEAVETKLAELLFGFSKPLKVVDKFPMSTIVERAIKEFDDDEARGIFIRSVVKITTILSQSRIMCHAVNRNVKSPDEIPPISDDGWTFYNDEEWKAVYDKLYAECQGLQRDGFGAAGDTKLLIDPDIPNGYIAWVMDNVAVTEVEIGLPSGVSIDIIVSEVKSTVAAQKTSSAGMLLNIDDLTSLTPKNLEHDMATAEGDLLKVLTYSKLTAELFRLKGAGVIAINNESIPPSQRTEAYRIYDKESLILKELERLTGCIIRLVTQLEETDTKDRQLVIISNEIIPGYEKARYVGIKNNIPSLSDSYLPLIPLIGVAKILLSSKDLDSIKNALNTNDFYHKVFGQNITDEIIQSYLNTGFFDLPVPKFDYKEVEMLQRIALAALIAA